MKDNFLLVRYEDFTQKTDIEFKNICRFLKVPFEKEAIIETSPDLTKWSIDPHLFAEITPKTKKWQDYISLKSAKYIETQLTEEMKVLNYERYTKNLNSVRNFFPKGEKSPSGTIKKEFGKIKSNIDGGSPN